MRGALPAAPKEFDKAYIERIFDAPAGSLNGIRYEPVGTGQVCDSYRFLCDWASDGGKGAAASGTSPPPISFIAKCPSSDAVSRGAAALFHLYDMEIGWYRDLANGSDVKCPQCFHADISEDEQSFVLILEDMEPAQQGDQLAGASLLQVQSTLVEAAKLHSLTPSNASFDQLSWLHHAAQNGAFLEQTLTASFAIFKERFVRLLAAEHMALAAELIDKLPAYLNHEPAELGITHGDMRLDNILFHADGRLAALVDWQTCTLGNPASDVAYMIGTSFANSEDRRDYEQRLVQDYLASRRRNGSKTPDFDIFWPEYRRCAFAGLIMAINAAQYVEQTERGDAMFAAMAARPAQMAIDLDSVNLLG